MPVFSISIRELRPRLPEVVADISENMNRYVITKRGKPACVILNKDEYDTMLESLGLQRNEKLMNELTESDVAFKKKKGRSIEDIRREL